MTMNHTYYQKGKPALLKAIELILAHPSDIKRKVQRLKAKYLQRYSNTVNEPAINDWMADKLISTYSTKAGISGGATAFIGIIPGMGTAIEIFGGATADIALCMKFQIEMTMALADLYGQDIESEEGKRRHFIIAGLGTINMEAVKQGGEQAAKLFTRIVQRYVQESSFEAVRIIFRKVTITLSKRALQKAIPFGIGAIIGFTSNKTFTWVVGQRAKEFFASSTTSRVIITPYKALEDYKR
jgi:uncharacterized protein (DUF697 family)